MIQFHGYWLNMHGPELPPREVVATRSTPTLQELRTSTGKQLPMASPCHRAIEQRVEQSTSATLGYSTGKSNLFLGFPGSRCAMASFFGSRIEHPHIRSQRMVSGLWLTKDLRVTNLQLVGGFNPTINQPFQVLGTYKNK